MKEKQLRKLRRADLLDLLLQQVRENDRLKKELEEKDKALLKYQIQCEEAGSIAQAALDINQVFETAQRAADQYLEGIRVLKKRLEQQCDALPDPGETDSEESAGTPPGQDCSREMLDYETVLSALKSREDGL